MADDFYRLLGLQDDAPAKAIKRSYHNLARKLHPDKASSPEEAKELQEKFAAITKAYNTLKDEKKRAEYDSKRGTINNNDSPAVDGETTLPVTDDSPSSKSQRINANMEKGRK